MSLEAPDIYTQIIPSILSVISAAAKCFPKREVSAALFSWPIEEERDVIHSGVISLGSNLRLGGYEGGSSRGRIGPLHGNIGDRYILVMRSAVKGVPAYTYNPGLGILEELGDTR